MREIERERFNTGMAHLRERYGVFFGDGSEWQRRLDAFFDQLKKHEWEHVRSALIRASDPDHYPDKFPTAGQLERLTRTAAFERRHAAQVEAQRHESAAENDRLREAFELIPLGAADQAAYIAEATEPFTRLARQWECESRRLCLDPTKPSPPAIQERRNREFWAMWNSVHEGSRLLASGSEP